MHVNKIYGNITDKRNILQIYYVKMYRLKQISASCWKATFNPGAHFLPIYCRYENVASTYHIKVHKIEIMQNSINKLKKNSCQVQFV